MSDDGLLQAIRSLVQAVQAQTAAIQLVFPNTTGTSATATAGAATLPANPVKFITVSVSGTSFKIPLYNT